MSRREFRHVATCLLRPESRLIQPTDSELLARFADTRDEIAFAELVARHGGLVLGTARRCLRDLHAAEDVYQATFMTLARKAGGVRWAATIGPWLHATAVRLARKALCRTSSAPVALPIEITSPGVDTATAVAWGEICQILDEELVALPEKLCEPLVLCYLQGYTRDEAAQAAGCSLAMLKRRLERGRRLLSDRLMRRGVTLPAAGVGLLACDLTASATAVDVTARAAVAFATQGIASPGTAGLLNISRGSLKLKAVTLAAAAVGMVACGIAFATFSQSAREQPDTPKQPGVTAPRADDMALADNPGEALPPGAIARLGSVRLRPGDIIVRMAFSPDGTKLASFSASSDSNTNRAFTIWDTRTGRALRRVEMSGGISLLVWLADGRGIALVLQGGPGSYLWEFTDEKAEKPVILPRIRGEVGSAAVPNIIEDNEQDSCWAISSDGKILAIGHAGQLQLDREVQFWELKTGAKVDTLKPLKGGVIHPGNCGTIHFTPDSKTLVVITRAKSIGNNKYEGEQLVTVWDVATSREKSRFKAPRPTTNFGTAVALSNSTLAIGQENGDTSLWNLTTGKEQKLTTRHDSKKPEERYGGCCAIAFTPDGKTLATGGRNNVTKLWDITSGKLLHTLAQHYNWVEALAIAPSGKLLANAGHDGLIRLWDIATGTDACPLPGHKSSLGNVELSPDGKFAITTGRDETIRWWDVEKSAELRSIAVPGIWAINLSPDGKTVLVGTEEGKLRIWDVATGRETTPINLPDDMKLAHFTFTPNGKNLVVGSGQKATIWEWPAVKLVRTIDLPKPSKDRPNLPDNSENWCRFVTVSPDGKWLVTMTHREWYREYETGRSGSQADGVVDVWELATGKRVRRLAESSAPFRNGMFTPDGLFILIGARGTIPAADGRREQELTGEINLFDPVAGRHVRGFEVPPVPDHVWYRSIGDSVLSPDGRTLYVSYNTGEIIAYEVATGKPRRTLIGHRGYVAGLAMNADGRRLISGGNDGLALVWDVTLAGAVIPRKNVIAAADAEKLWKEIGQDDGRVAFAALASLVASPDRAMEIIQREIKPTPTPTTATLDRIFSNLDSEDFATRENAAKELEELGQLAAPAVRKRLEGNPSAEIRQRAEAFLKRLDSVYPSAMRLRQIRAVELLEGLGTPAARKLLTELAAGAPAAALTRDASAALKRLNK